MMVETGTTNLVDILSAIGVEVTKVGEKEITGRCPVHVQRTGKTDRSPSWSMNASTGAWICFSCGAKGSLMGLVQDLTGSSQLAYDYYATIATMGLERLEMPVVEKTPDVDWVAYHKFPQVPDEELEKRNLTRESATLHGLKWDSSNGCWVIPIMDSSHLLLGWQLKKKGWVRNFPIGVKKSKTLFGIQRFRGGTAVLVESPLDVVRLTSIGYPLQGLATFGTAVSEAQIKLVSEKATRVIIAMDNDQAGIEASKKLFNTLPRFRDGILWVHYKNDSAKDIGDMNDDDIRDLLDNASAIPGWF